jgi:hypothetical protein
MPTSAAMVTMRDDGPEMGNALRLLFTSRGFRIEEYGENLLAAIGSHPLDQEELKKIGPERG